jgi:hypothetical protein
LRNADDPLIHGNAEPLLEQVAHVAGQMASVRSRSDQQVHLARVSVYILPHERAHDRWQLAQKCFGGFFRMRFGHCAPPGNVVQDVPARRHRARVFQSY